MQAGAGGIWNGVQADAPDTHSILLGGNDDQGFVLCLPADYARFSASPNGLVHLNNAISHRGLHGPEEYIRVLSRTVCVIGTFI